jgi:hypothetical protein
MEGFVFTLDLVVTGLVLLLVVFTLFKLLLRGLSGGVSKH